MLSKVTIIVNPVSGRGTAKGRAKEIEQQARKLGWDGELVETSLNYAADYHATQALAKGHRHIVVCGGDGSVREALDALVGVPDAQLGIVPLGTGNLLAHNLRLPLDIRSALKVALLGTPTKLDVGRANGRYFGVVAGIGWDGAMVRDTHRKLKDQFGLTAYLLSALKNLSHPSEQFRVKVDSNPTLTFTAKSILVANVGRVSGAVNLLPQARMNDGLLDLVVVQTETLSSWAALAMSGLTGTLHRDPRTVHLTCKEVKITAKYSRQPIELDGNDYLPTRQLSVSIIPLGIRVLLAKPNELV